MPLQLREAIGHCEGFDLQGTKEDAANGVGRYLGKHTIIRSMRLLYCIKQLLGAGKMQSTWLCPGNRWRTYRESSSCKFICVGLICFSGHQGWGTSQSDGISGLSRFMKPCHHSALITHVDRELLRSPRIRMIPLHRKRFEMYKSETSPLRLLHTPNSKRPIRDQKAAIM